MIIDWNYMFLSFILSVLFLITLFTNFSTDSEDKLLYNSNIYLLAFLLSLIMYSYHKSIKLCGFLLVILAIYIIKKNIKTI